MKISDENLTYILDKPYQVEIDNRIKYLRDVAEEMVDNYINEGNFIDTEFIFSHDLNTTVHLHPDGDLIYFLRDEKFSDLEESFIYSFAIDINNANG